MRILFVADVSPVEVIGGAERVLREHVIRLSPRGHNVTVLSRCSGEAPGMAQVDGVKVYLLRTGAFVLWDSLNRFKSIAKDERPELINFHQPFAALGVLLSPRSWRVPKVYTFHSPSFLEYEIRGKAKGSGWFRLLMGSLVRRIAEYICLKVSDRIIVLSEFSKRLIHKYYRIPESKMALVPGGVDTRKFFPPSDRESIRRSLRIPEGRVFLFTVRNLVPRMGLEDLILAIKELKEVRREVFLVIGGEGMLEGKLRELVRKLGVEEFVRFEGYIPDEDLPMYFQGADYFVLPTRSLEGFGLVTVEALACGTPVLGTPVGAIPEVLSKLDRSLLAEGSGPEQIAELLIAHTSPEGLERARKLRPRCRELAVQQYDWERVVDRLEVLFRQLRAGVRGPRS